MWIYLAKCWLEDEEVDKNKFGISWSLLESLKEQARKEKGEDKHRSSCFSAAFCFGWLQNGTSAIRSDTRQSILTIKIGFWPTERSR